MAPSTAVSAKPRAVIDGAAEPLLYRALRGPVRALLQRWFDFAVEGLEHVPARGPYIVAANHHNYLDGVLLGAAVPEPIVFLVMPRVYRATPLHPPFHRHMGSIPINLERPDVAALRSALGALERGRIVGIFPEGPFSVRGRLEPGLPGVALLALRSGAPVVPAAIRGTYQALVGRRFYIPRRHPLGVRFGPPRVFTSARGARAREARERVTQRVMADIAALLS
ncbi:MAG TPA: lysophospholipid acyltransferase family protein [Methylomirabilota bacterium]|jgi:1-acyl-sn-glycerol-3-phosphate acyltransferase|nr:lysophospholipid acyltransferase family protein [Methylomirabilota bacterium]